MNIEIKDFDCDTDVQNIGSRWELWLENLTAYFEINDIKDPAKKANYLKVFGGMRLQQILKTLGNSKIDEKSNMDEYKRMTSRLNAHFIKKPNYLVERLKFRNMSQSDTETLDQFATRLRLAAAKCNFETRFNEEIRDQIIQKCNSQKLRTYFIAKGEIKLEQVLENGRLFETLKDAVVTKKESTPSRPSATERKICFNCGGKEYPHKAECPAKTHNCKVCKRLGHFERVCRVKAETNKAMSSKSEPMKKETKIEVALKGNKTAQVTVKQQQSNKAKYASNLNLSIDSTGFKAKDDCKKRNKSGVGRTLKKIGVSESNELKLRRV